MRWSLFAKSWARPLRRRFAAAAWSDRMAPALVQDITELTGVKPGDGLQHLTPSKRAFFRGIMMDALESGRLTPEMRGEWATVCKGGIVMDRSDLVAAHLRNARDAERQEARGPSDGEDQAVMFADDVSQENMCDAPVDKLRKMSISELTLDTVHVGRVLWLSLAVDAMKFTADAAVAAVVDDDHGGATVLYLYNAVHPDAKHADVEAKFPLGRRLAIKHPYYRVGMGGLRELRCDNPCNVFWADAAEAKGADAGELKATVVKGTVVGPVKVVFLEGRGRGLVTTKNVRRGDLLVREHALACVDAPKESKFLFSGDGRMWGGSKVDLVAALVSQLADDLVLRARVSTLHDGSSRSDVPDMSLFLDDASVKDVPHVSAARASRIIDMNTYATGASLQVDVEKDQGKGIFAVSSFLNHAEDACINVDREEENRTMSLYARFDLEAGTELTTSYFPDDGSCGGTMAKRRLHYGIPEPNADPNAPAVQPAAEPAAEPVAEPAETIFVSEPLAGAAPPAEPRWSPVKPAVAPPPIDLPSKGQLFTSRPGSKAPPGKACSKAPLGKAKKKKR